MVLTVNLFDRQIHVTDDNFHRLQYINFLYDFPASINKFVEKDRQADEVGKMCYAANRTILHRRHNETPRHTIRVVTTMRYTNRRLLTYLLAI